ncbi:hypothetical protein A3749_11590 [Oleiphilus sp. HI0078]|nr:hypothetical protein A3749_11590 [Oleiphilus sp. HI0078]
MVDEFPFDPNRQQPHQELIRGPYLQMSTNTGMTIKWRTDNKLNSVVYYGQNPYKLDQSAAQFEPTTEHSISLTNLAPNTLYYYEVGTSTYKLTGNIHTSFFKTSSPANSSEPTRIWVIGDSGNASQSQANVYDAFKAYSQNSRTDLFILLGDIAYPDGTDNEFRRAFFNVYPDLIRSSPAWPTFGNHDANSADSITESGPYYDIFTLPRMAEAGGLASGTESYYSFDYGNIHFIVLDSSESDRNRFGPMITWMENDLRQTSSDWIIAYWHHPPYSKGSHDSDAESPLIQMRENALPILEEYGVDLILSGHSHSYERSHFISGHYGSSESFDSSEHIIQEDDHIYSKSILKSPNDGTIYAVVGSSGKVTGSGLLDHPAIHTSHKSLGSLVIDINKVELKANFIDDKESLLDYFRIIKR